MHQVPTPIGETANNHAVTARVTQRKYYSFDNDFLSTSKCVTAGQLCHLLQVQAVSHSSQRQIRIHIHRIVFFVVVEDAVLAQSTHSQSVHSGTAF